MKITLAGGTASDGSLWNEIAPFILAMAKTSSMAGSMKGISPPVSRTTFRSSMSKTRTRWPSDAIHAPETSPT
jgi:hypothetical protein